jgi:hypothetical protein
MKTKISTLKTYYVNGAPKTVKYTSKVNNVDKLFNNTILDASFLADSSGGEISVQRTDSFLKITYLGVGNMIDHIKLIAY